MKNDERIKNKEYIPIEELYELNGLYKFSFKHSIAKFETRWILNSNQYYDIIRLDYRRYITSFNVHLLGFY